MGYIRWMTMLTLSSAEAARSLGLNDHSVAKLKDAGLLLGPPDVNGRRKGVYADSLQTARAVLPTTLAPGDVAFHVTALSADPKQHNGRPSAGWHQQASWAMSVADRRLAWCGVWEMAQDNALEHVGRHAMATVSGFIVDLVKITGMRPCPCCGLVIFDVTDPDDEAAARYRGRRLSVRPGSLWTTG